MSIVTLLPADVYTVINKGLLTEIDKNNVITLYEPIIGSLAVSLYFTLWRDLDKLEILSKDYHHHHLMTIMKTDLNSIKKAREALEAVGLLKTYYKAGEIGSYIYELYSPLSAIEFFNHPIFNIILYNNIGKAEYESLKLEYESVKFDLTDYEDISKNIAEVYESSDTIPEFDVRDKEKNSPSSLDKVDFDTIINALPKGIINEKALKKQVRDLINNLAFVYGFDEMQLTDLLRNVVNENGFIDKKALRIEARKYYQYAHDGRLPTLIYRTQPEYLKTPVGESNRAKIIYVFENTTPYDFLRRKQKGSTPNKRDLKLVEGLLMDTKLNPAVVNVLIDYVLKINNNKLNENFINAIASQWKRAGVETAPEAMALAEKEQKKYAKRIAVKSNVKHPDEKPVWFNKEYEKEEMSKEELQEIEDMFKEFR